MSSTYKPSGSRLGYQVPDLTDPPDVPGDMRAMLDTLGAKGYRLNFNDSRQTSREDVAAGDLASGPIPHELATFSDPASTFPDSQYCLAYCFGHAVVSSLGNAGFSMRFTIGNNWEGGWAITYGHTDGAAVDIAMVSSGWALSTADGFSDMKCFLLNGPGGTTVRLRSASISTEIWGLER